MRKTAARRNALAASFLLGACVAVGCAARRAPAVTSPSPTLTDWQRVINVQPGTTLKAEGPSGIVTAGRLVLADSDRIIVESRGQHVTLARSEIQRVSVRRRETGKQAKRGFMTGAVGGGLVGTLAAQSNRLPWAALLALGWGGVGALIGAIDGAQVSDETIIYFAPPTGGGRPR